MSHKQTDNPIIDGPVFITFLKYALPSILGLVAITTASLVDGMFVGHFVSADGLAAINLLIPYLTLTFGLALMLAIGGAVRGGHLLGQNKSFEASAVFSKCLVAIVFVGLFFLALSWLFDSTILSWLGTPDSLMGLILPYFRIISAVLVIQIFTMVLYYFVRLDNGQKLATTALVSGAMMNIVLDAIFIIGFDMGLVGAAWATAIAQTIQLVILSKFFFREHRQLFFCWPRQGWGELKQISFNGMSEFTNEISGGLVILVLNWLLVTTLDVEGVAAFAVINYLIFVSLMLYYGFADALHLLVSLNHGAGQYKRITQFVSVGITMVMLVGFGLTLTLLIWPQSLISLFLNQASMSTRTLSSEFISLIWPLFLINGVNVTLSIYLTAMQKPIPSMFIALSRSFVLPVGLLLLFSWLLPQPDFILALPIAEWLTFLLAAYLFWRFRPSKNKN